MTHILHRQLMQDYPAAVMARGLTIQDASGKVYIDASGGAAVSCLGHSHPDVIAAMHAQIDRLDFAHTSFFTSPVAEALAEEMVEKAPAGVSHVYFTSGGSESVEAALKLARQYFVERGEPERRHFIGRLQGYHGNTIGALSVGGNMWRRRQFEPILVEAHHVSPCNAYRGQGADETAEQYGERLAQELSDKIDELGGNTVTAFIAETVVGATSGAVPPVPGYFKRVREICDRHGILLILDEVMCGMGRTGTLHACEQEGIAPDLLTVAKGLGGGYAPIGALLVNGRIIDMISKGTGFFQHGHTYIGHPLACAAALAVQRVIERDNLLANVREQGARLACRLRERFANHDSIGDVRGRGLFQAVELVADRDSKEPFDPSLKLHARIKKEAMARGLIVYPMGGGVDGVKGDHVLLAPPFIIDGQAIDLIVERLGDSVDAALASVRN